MRKKLAATTVIALVTAFIINGGVHFNVPRTNYAISWFRVRVPPPSPVEQKATAKQISQIADETCKIEGHRITIAMRKFYHNKWASID